MATEEEMSKQKRTKRSSESQSSHPPPRSFMSLPHDVVLNCMARISRSHHSIISLASKSFRSLLASPDLEALRKPEKLLYVCLSLKDNPSWFVLSPAPKQKLIPIPSFPNFPNQHPNSSTVVSVGSDIYLIGGSVRGKRSRRVFLLDCKSHQWRQLPKMRVSRKEAAGVVTNGKVYVTGGCSNVYNDTENFGEVYNPKTQTWEPTVTEMGRKQLFRVKTGRGLGCLVDVEINHSLAQYLIMVFNGTLRCGGPSRTVRASGLEELDSNYLISVANPGGGSRVTVWWKTYNTKECKTEIWCAEILIEFLPPSKFKGTVEWSENVFTFQGCESGDPDLLLHSALVTHS
ncbi:putative F-box/kelch-repeat protein [Cardamine amara subsp. amara]|uniref:F-box/kelch-repeat protein n=1 Tax=Cardamine amara subsp. amara TaxID=228776 RepID=A0ABD1A6Z5_CARAN